MASVCGGKSLRRATLSIRFLAVSDGIDSHVVGSTIPRIRIQNSHGCDDMGRPWLSRSPATPGFSQVGCGAAEGETVLTVSSHRNAFIRKLLK